MTRSNKKSAFAPWARLVRRIAVVSRFLAFRAEGRLTLVGLALLGVLTVGPYWAWRQVGDRVAAGDDYRLTAGSISDASMATISPDFITLPYAVNAARKDL